MHLLFVPLVQLVSLTLSAVGAEISNNFFINPPKSGPTGQFGTNNVYAVGSQIDVSWNTTWTDYMLVLYQEQNDTYQTLARSSEINNGETKYRWRTTVDGRFDLRHQNVFFFAIYPLQSTATSTFFSCHYFNITNNDVDAAGNIVTSSSTSSLSTATPTAASSNTTSISSSNPTGAPSEQKSDSKVSLGVGLGLGIPLAILVAFGFGYVLRGRKKHRGGALDANAEKDAYYHAGQNSSVHPYMAHQGSSQELDGSNMPGELPSGQTTHVELPAYAKR